MSKEKLSDWVKSYTKARKELGHETSSFLADKWTQRTQAADNIKLSGSFVENDGEMISKGANGTFYVDAVLSSTQTDREGDKVDESLLSKWADQINKNKPVGDVNHGWFNKKTKEVLDSEELKKELPNKPGITEDIKAWVEDGSLKIRTWVKKQYRDVLDKVKGVSVELGKAKRMGNKIVDGELLGWSFEENPAGDNHIIEKIED